MNFRYISHILGGVNIEAQTEHVLYQILTDHWVALLNGMSVSGVEVFSEGIFALQTQHNIVFKIGKDVQDRWQHVKRGASVCQTQGLDLLVLPCQSLLEMFINDVDRFVIAEERLPLSHDFIVQANLYSYLGPRLNPALEQLVIFIIRTGFRDIDFRNIPILDRNLRTETTPQIVLVDLENCAPPIVGANNDAIYESAFFGNGGLTRGLLRCVTPANFESIRIAAKSEQVVLELIGAYEDTVNQRALELEEKRQYNAILENQQVYEDQIRQFVLCLMGSITGTVATCESIQTHPVSPTVWMNRIGACRRFETYSYVLGRRMALRGAVVLNINLKLVATSVVIEGFPSLEIDKETTEHDMQKLFEDEVRDSRMSRMDDKLFCFFSPERNPNYGILKAPLLSRLFDDKSV